MVYGGKDAIGHSIHEADENSFIHGFACWPNFVAGKVTQDKASAHCQYHSMYFYEKVNNMK